VTLYFIDTSALTKLYVRELGTDLMLGLAAEGRTQRMALLSVTPLEFRSAVRRRERQGDIDPEDVKRILAAFSADLASRFQRQPVTEFVLEIALNLIDRHALRAYDALQLGGCMALRSSSGEEEPIFLCADKALCRAAVSEEVSVINPEVVCS